MRNKLVTMFVMSSLLVAAIAFTAGIQADVQLLGMDKGSDNTLSGAIVVRESLSTSTAEVRADLEDTTGYVIVVK